MTSEQPAAFITWIDDPPNNGRYYRHIGCAAWTVPLDDCPPPAPDETDECAECAQVLPVMHAEMILPLRHYLMKQARALTEADQAAKTAKEIMSGHPAPATCGIECDCPRRIGDWFQPCPRSPSRQTEESSSSPSSPDPA